LFSEAKEKLFIVQIFNQEKGRERERERGGQRAAYNSVNSYYTLQILIFIIQKMKKNKECLI
jgi:hypothetical protein